MKILIATGIYGGLGDIGGPAIYSESLARELIKRGHKVTVVTYSSSYKSEIRNPPPKADQSLTEKSETNPKSEIQNSNFLLVRVQRELPLLLRYSFYKLTALWHGWHADIIYAQDSVSAGFPTMLANLILRKPFILKVIGDYAWEQYQNQKSKIKNQKLGMLPSSIDHNGLSLDDFLNEKPSGKIKAFWNIERWVARRANKIIVPSNYLRGVVQKWGIQSAKIEVIYNSFDWSSLQNSISKVPVETPEATPHDTIYSVGRLVPWKGFDTLIEIMPEALKEKPNTELVIYGDGPMREGLRFKIKDLGLETHVKLLGRIDHAKLLEALQGERKFFVLNSSYEGMSHQILECQALKIPCAVSRVGGNPEIVENEKTGLLFEYNNKEQIKNAIIRLLDEQALVEHIREKAYAQIKDRHDFNQMIEKTITVLQSTLSYYIV